MELPEGFHIMQDKDTSYLDDILKDSDGKLKIVSYKLLENVPQHDISLYCLKNGLYNLPTQELIYFLLDEIAGGSAIEIGAGNGVMAKELGIKATDSYMQEEPEIMRVYKAAGQALVTYGDNVQRLDGIRAIESYKPNTVIAAWLTHRYNPAEHWRGGNQYAPSEHQILKLVKKFILIGNTETHAKNPILKNRHREIKQPWLISRSPYRDKNVIWIWDR